jgi:hypothetical protein
LKVKPANNTFAGEGMIILHKLGGEPKVPELIRAIHFHEEPAIITVRFGHDDNDVLQMS